VWPLAATDLIAHAANHGAAGSDPLPVGTITNDMMGRTITATGTLTGSTDVAFGNAAYVELMSVSITTLSTQILTLVGSLAVENRDTASARTVDLRLQDTTNGVTLYQYPPLELGASTVSPPRHIPFPASCAVSLTAGTRTIKLQGAAGAANKVYANYSETDRTSATIHPSTIQFILG